MNISIYSSFNVEATLKIATVATHLITLIAQEARKSILSKIWPTKKRLQLKEAKRLLTSVEYPSQLSHCSRPIRRRQFCCMLKKWQQAIFGQSKFLALFISSWDLDSPSISIKEDLDYDYYLMLLMIILVSYSCLKRDFNSSCLQ